MSISHIIARQNIREVLHFTTNEGLVGVLQSGAVLPRSQLPKEKYLQHIYKPNCRIRKDTAWLDYVNLSISWINPELFRISSGHWHKDRDIFWCVLSFDPAILDHPGVYFVTTNNMYSGAIRGTGDLGLSSLFAARVIQYVERQNGRLVPVKSINRLKKHPVHLPTCSQAELLYPGALSLEYLKGVYAPTNDLALRVHATASVVLERDVEVWVKPDLFEGEAPETET
jgi:hypothetical protein